MDFKLVKHSCNCQTNKRNPSEKRTFIYLNQFIGNQFMGVLLLAQIFAMCLCLQAENGKFCFGLFLKIDLLVIVRLIVKDKHIGWLEFRK